MIIKIKILKDKIVVLKRQNSGHYFYKIIGLNGRMPANWVASSAADAAILADFDSAEDLRDFFKC